MIEPLYLLRTIARRAGLSGNSGISAGALEPLPTAAGGFPHFPLVRYPLAPFFPIKEMVADASAVSAGEGARFGRVDKLSDERATSRPLFFRFDNGCRPGTTTKHCGSKNYSTRFCRVGARAQDSNASEERHCARPTRVHIFPHLFNMSPATSSGSGNCVVGGRWTCGRPPSCILPLRRRN